MCLFIICRGKEDLPKKFEYDVNNEGFKGAGRDREEPGKWGQGTWGPGRGRTGRWGSNREGPQKWRPGRGGSGRGELGRTVPFRGGPGKEDPGGGGARQEHYYDHRDPYFGDQDDRTYYNYG